MLLFPQQVYRPPSYEQCEVFSFNESLGFRPNGPFDCLARANGPGSIASMTIRPEGPTVCNVDKRPTLWAFKYSRIEHLGRWPRLCKWLGLWPRIAKTTLKMLHIASASNSTAENTVPGQNVQPVYNTGNKMTPAMIRSDRLSETTGIS